MCLPRPEGSRNAAPRVPTASKAAFHRRSLHAPLRPAANPAELRGVRWGRRTHGCTLEQPPPARQELPLSSFYKRGYWGSRRFCEGAKERASRAPHLPGPGEGDGEVSRIEARDRECDRSRRGCNGSSRTFSSRLCEPGTMREAPALAGRAKQACEPLSADPLRPPPRPVSMTRASARSPGPCRQLRPGSWSLLCPQAWPAAPATSTRSRT